MIAAKDKPCGGVVVNQTDVTCPEVLACLPFATPAETIAGTATDLIVNPADLVARENIPAQTGLGLVLSTIPVPAANQSDWGVNTLGETLHYAPGLGWKIVSDRYSEKITVPAGVSISGVQSLALFTAPRSGKLQISSFLGVNVPANHERVLLYVWQNYGAVIARSGGYQYFSSLSDVGNLEIGSSYVFDVQAGDVFQLVSNTFPSAVTYDGALKINYIE